MKNQKSIFQKFVLSAVFMLVFLGGFGLLKVSSAQAVYCAYRQTAFAWWGTANDTFEITQTNSDKECQELCRGILVTKLNCTSAETEDEAKKLLQKIQGLSPQEAVQKQDDKNMNEPRDGLLTSAIKWFLGGLLTVIGWLISLAATLFEYIIQPQALNAAISNPAIYTIWTLVRDTLNVAFILVLLFSAFATVFQVEKFSYKRILLTVVIMALLVNFSFPIARVIIDFSNVIMYYFLNSLGGPGSFAKIASHGGIAKILNPGSADITFLIAAIIFSFIFAITILVIAVLLVIRTVALAILIIFSPVAFVGTIVPFLSSKASSWWDNLFKYSFFGPVMVFMVYVSVKLMEEIAVRGPEFGLKQIANVQASSASSEFIASIAFFSIAIVILWFGIGTAQSMSIAGAGLVTKKAQQWGTWLATRPHKSAWWLAKQTGVPGGVQQKYAHWKKGGLFGSEAREEREARIAGGLGVPKVVEQLDAKKVKDAKEKHDAGNMTGGDLQNLITIGNRFEKAAAIEELANRGQATASNLNEMRTTFGETSQVFKQLASKIKAYDPVAAFATAIDADGNVTDFNNERMLEHVNSNQFDFKKVSANSLGNGDFMQMLFENNAMSVKDIMDTAKGSASKKDALNRSVESLLSVNTNTEDKIAQNIHMTRFAQTGLLSNGDFAKHVFGNMSDETAAGMKLETVNNHSYEIARFAKNYKKTLQGIKDDGVKRTLNSRMQNMTDADIRAIIDDNERENARSIHHISLNDNQIQNLR